MAPEMKVTIRENRLMITADLPGLRSDHFEITVEGNHLRLVSKQSDGCGPFESEVEIPPGFDVSQVSAAYLNGQLRLVFPPLDGGSAPNQTALPLFSSN